MTITIAGQPRQAFELLERTRLVLRVVDGGSQWLAWAERTGSDRFDFADETAFIAQLQAGLHASPFTLLPRLGLMVSPVKLMTLGDADLRVLLRAEQGDDSALMATQLQRVLSDHRLLTQADLRKPADWLRTLQVGDAPVFQGVDFMDRVALHQLMNDPLLADREPLDVEAAAFAAQEARTPMEFTDYVRMYLLAGAALGADATADQRLARARQCTQALLPLFFGHLDCPQVGPLAAPDDVAAAVGAWRAGGQQVGFMRVSEGPALLMRHTRYEDETGEAARQLVQAYVGQAQALLSQVKPTRGRMGQDGQTCTFVLHAPSGDEQAVLQLGANGIISLREYGLRPAEGALPAAAPPAAPARIVHDPELSS